MTPSPSPDRATRRYLALWLPNLAEDCWRLADGSPAARDMSPAPAVFTEQQANAVRLTAVSRAAAAAGLVPGLTLADARARVPDLVAIARDPAGEARLLVRIVAALARYTPMAAATPPDGAVLDIAGCTHPFGGERGLRADLLARLAAWGLAARAACGATPEAARARARFGPERGDGGGDLHDLPVEAIEAAPETITALRRAGLKTIGALASRPRSMLAARFGDLALRLTRLLGEEDRRITPARPLPPVFALRRFAEPIGRVEDALACLGELAAEAGVILRERHQGGRRFAARLFRSDGAVPMLAIETGRPTRDPALVMRLFHERLDALADPIDPGFGFDMVRLDIPATEPLAPAQAGLDGAAEDNAPLAELVDRLVARLGAGRIRRMAPHDSHIPECAAAAASPQALPSWPAPAAGEPPLRPLRLFDPPQPIAVLHGVPDGPPVRFVWHRRQHHVARWEGPERIAPEWWRRRIDAATWMRRDEAGHPLAPPAAAAGLTRDYYRVEDEAGHRFWLFRHGLPGTERKTPAWYLHGLFA